MIKDYTNNKFGSLTAIRISGYVQHGRNRVKVWLCTCDCGNEIEVDQVSLVKGIVAACKTCRRKPCVICGKTITNESYGVKRETCSDECLKEQVKIRHRKHYYALVENDPDHNKKYYKKRVERDSDYNKKRYQRKKQINNT